MLVFVTQEHIEQAKRYQVGSQVPMSLHCPLALALEDIFPGKSACVSPSGVTVVDRTDGVFVEYTVPSKASVFIFQFDMSLPVEPGAYELRQDPIHVPLND